MIGLQNNRPWSFKFCITLRMNLFMHFSLQGESAPFEVKLGLDVGRHRLEASWGGRPECFSSGGGSRCS